MFRSLVPWQERLPVAFPQFESEMEELMQRFFGNHEEWKMSRFTPSMNLAETDDAFEVTVELAGMKPEEVNVEFKEGSLWIHGEKKEEQEEKNKTFHRVERRHGEFRRVIKLPGAVNEAKVEAKFTDGVLNITVPKKAEVKAKKIQVKT